MITLKLLQIDTVYTMVSTEIRSRARGTLRARLSKYVLNYVLWESVNRPVQNAIRVPVYEMVSAGIQAPR